MRIIRGGDIRNGWGRQETGKNVLAVGNFDGVHLGHQKVFDFTVSRAKALGLTAAVLTFAQHPLQTLQPELAPRPLMDLENRLKIAGNWGFEKAFILDFDPELASMSPELFAVKVLVESLGAAGIVAGSGWRFGRARTGDMDLLRTVAGKRDLNVWEVEPAMMDGKPVSSTRIRDLLASGDVTKARELLGRPHYVSGVVREGRSRGHMIGFPTVNLDTGHLMVPADGVYAGAYLLPGLTGPAAVNVGPSPTFKDSIAGIEAHLVQWEGDLYGESVIVAFLQRLRDEKTFTDLDTLSRQIAVDADRAVELFTPQAVEGIEP